MTDVQNSDLFLVGSMAVPSDSVDEALQIGAKALGDRLFALPDGEVGLRSWWIAGLGQLTFSRHPDLDEGPESSGSPQPLGTFGVYSVKKGVTRVDLEGYLPYAQAAIDSYAIFRKLKDSKELPEDVRFQVALPTPFAAIMPFFQDTSDWPEMNAAWMRAVHADIARILEVIPAHELMIQWDYCTEVCDIVGTVSGRRELEAFLSWIPDDTAAGKCATHTAPEYLRPLAEGIPDQVKFGYHICLGTFPQFPITPIDDLSWIVRMANALVKNTRARWTSFIFRLRSTLTGISLHRSRISTSATLECSSGLDTAMVPRPSPPGVDWRANFCLISVSRITVDTDATIVLGSANYWAIYAVPPICSGRRRHERCRTSLH